ncbi:hypothetical protein GCM10018785_35920 [Streptomyces longispororuber]|uniref:Secreted protein n=1 Tax=Streptomyces longispororuber TaxID=68230 RepID=A0A919DPT5_9ACTN|nr:hypothetical protein [Streptomyces longispororuber]GHE63816.1 hypothetical protein GCM10018785_35920 [Streptomyces longispororuber]
MRTTQISLRSGLTVAAMALPLALGAPAALAAQGISVSVDGSTVRATTTACSTGGKASLLSDGVANFSQGRQATLAGGSASWQNVAPGTHTVVVLCDDGTTAGSQAVTVGGAPPTPTAPTTPTVAPTTSSTTAPARGVRGGLGGAVESYGTVTLAAGGVLVAAAVGGGVWYVRRRTVRSHF